MEMFDIVNRDGTKTGKTKEREAVHTDGDWHQSVHIWIASGGKVLLQKRKEDKDSFPNCYDIASAGHVDLGEDFVTSALRELKEELSITAKSNDLKYLFTQELCVDKMFFNRHFVSNELNAVFLLTKDIQGEKLTFQESEISALKWEDIDELKSHINDGNYCIKEDEFLKVLPFIEK